MPFQTVFELLIIYGWLVKRLPTATVWQDEPGDAAHIIFHHLCSPFIGRQGEGGPVHGDVSAHAIDVKVHANARNQPQHGIVQVHCREPVLRLDESRALSVFCVSPLRPEPLGVAIEGNAPSHHFGPHLDIPLSLHVYCQTKAVQQLGPQFSLLGVHGPHEDKCGGMAHRNTFALNIIHAHSCGIEQDIDQMVAEQIDLVDVQQPTMRCRQEARLKMLFTTLQGTLDI